MMSIDAEYDYYLENRASLLKKYKNKFIVIRNQKVIGSYSSEREAYESAIREYKAGNFLIQKCVPPQKTPLQTFHSRVVFS